VTETTLRFTKPEVYGVDPELVPAYLGIFRYAGITYAGTYTADGEYIADLDSTNNDPTIAGPALCCTPGGTLVWRPSGTTLRSWNAVGGAEELYTAPLTRLVSGPVAAGSQVYWVEHSPSSTTSITPLLRLAGASNLAAANTDAFRTITVSGALSWVAPRGLVLNNGTEPGAAAVTMIGTVSGRYWLVRLYGGSGSFGIPSAHAEITGGADELAAMYGTSTDLSTQAPAAVGHQWGTGTPANTFRLRVKPYTTTEDFANGWPNTGSWVLDEVLNYSAAPGIITADALLYGERGATRRIIRALGSATSGVPTVVIPAVHPTHGVQPDRVFFFAA